MDVAIPEENLSNTNCVQFHSLTNHVLPPMPWLGMLCRVRWRSVTSSYLFILVMSHHHIVLSQTSIFSRRISFATLILKSWGLRYVLYEYWVFSFCSIMNCMQPWMWNFLLCFQFWRKPLWSSYLQGQCSACTHYINRCTTRSQSLFTWNKLKILLKENQEIFPFIGSPSFIGVSMWSTLMPVTLHEKFPEFCGQVRNTAYPHRCTSNFIFLEFKNCELQMLPS